MPNLTEQQVQAILQEAESGNPSQQFNAGLIYYMGNGRAKDINEAIKWFEKAATQGHKKAQRNLAVIYRKEIINVERAIYWFERLIEGGEKFHFDTAVLYFEKEDYIKAYEYMTVAASQPEHRSEATFRLGVMDKFGHNRERTPNLKRAFEHFEAAAQMQNRNAKMALAECYALELSVGKNPEKAIYYAKQAATQGNRTANGLVGVMEGHGFGTKANPDAAIIRLENLLASGEKEFRMDLAELHYKKGNIPRAKELFKAESTEDNEHSKRAKQFLETIELKALSDALSFISGSAAEAGAGSSSKISFVDMFQPKSTLTDLPGDYIRTVPAQQVTSLLSKVTGLAFTAVLKDTESYRVDALIEAKQVADQAKLSALGISYNRKNLDGKDYLIIEGVNMHATALQIQDAYNSNKGHEVRCR
jgi:TPR repeat protein